MANIRGARYTDGVSSSLIKRDVLEAIFNFEPYQTPLEQWFMANKAARYATGNPKIEIQEDVLVAHSFSPTAAYTSAGTTATITVGTTNVKNVIVGTVIRNTATNQNYQVTAINDGAGTFDILLIGSGTISNVATTDVFLVSGTAFPEGGSAAQALSTVSTFPYNYTQIHKEAVHMTGTQMATVNYGGSDWVNQRMKATKQIKLKLERTWFYGVRDLDGSSSTLTRFSGGLMDDASLGISDRDQFTGTSFASESFFLKTYLKSLFAKGTNRKTLYCGADAILGIGDFSFVKQQTKVGEKEYGYDIRTIITPFGMADLVWHPILEGAYSNWVVGVDRDNYLRYAYLTGNGFNRDLQYQRDLETAGEDEKLDQYLVECSMHIAGGSQGVHRILYPGA